MLPGRAASAQPKLVMVPETVSPCRGVSMVPNGLLLAAFANVSVFEPRSVFAPSIVRTYADKVNVPFPWFGSTFERSM